MADLSKLKRRNTLGAPPPLEEASRNLSAPEIAPVLERPASPPDTPVLPSRRAGSTGRVKEVGHPQPTRIDGRGLRKTGRTLQLSTRVSWEFDEKLRNIAQRDGLKLVEVLEKGLDAYESGREK
jgi:hypothetical protein